MVGGNVHLLFLLIWLPFIALATPGYVCNMYLYFLFLSFSVLFSYIYYQAAIVEFNNNFYS